MTSVAPSASGLGGIPPRVYLPILVIVGYIAFVISGFGSGLDGLQSLPIYIYFSLLLLVLQFSISENKSFTRFVYLILTSGFAIVYAGEVIYQPRTGNFTRSPWTYIVLNTLLLLVFLLDAIDRRRPRPHGLDATPQDTTRAQRLARAARWPAFSYATFATDFAGLAILFFIASFLVDLLDARRVPSLFGLHWSQYVSVDLQATLGIRFGAGFTHLETLDLVIAFGAAAISLLLLGLVGVSTLSTTQGAIRAPGRRVFTSPAQVFGAFLENSVGVALDQVRLSLRLVLGPLLWLIPAFSIGFFSQGVTTYLAVSSRATNANLANAILDLFNPFSAVGLGHVGLGLQNLGLALLAFLAVIVTVALVEYHGAVVRRTLRIFQAAGRTIALTLVFFIYSLAALNAFTVLFLSNKAEPFQVGAPGIIALVAAGAFVAYNLLAGPRATATAPAASGAPAVTADAALPGASSAAIPAANDAPGELLAALADEPDPTRAHGASQPVPVTSAERPADAGGAN